MEKEKVIQFAAQVDGIRTTKDGTLKVTLGTQELPPEDTAHIFAHNNRLVWVGIAETELSRTDLNIPEVVPEFRNDKSPSQRLRDVLFVYWKQENIQQDFDTYWKRYCEKQIDAIKDKLL